jgi:Zn-dependent peptidase ImmA (M78 family)/transcriptional regulator with XRE-family HTH domain
MTDSAVVGERVHRLRLASGLQQTQLAEALGLSSNGLISKIENGRMSVDDKLLVKLAKVLACSSDYLVQAPPNVTATRPLLRAYADAPSRVVESVSADNLLAFEFAAQEGLTFVPDSVPLFEGDLNDDDAIERFAEEARTAAQVAEGAVVSNAMRSAERLGCIILPLTGELGRHLGMSQRLDGRPFIRVAQACDAAGAPRVPGDRQRWTVLHELGHLCLHSDCGPPDSAEEARRIERQAHRFAAAFLAPAEPLLEDWQALGGRVTLRVLQQLKANWGVAIKALVTRFHHLRIISEDQARSLYRQISARGWSTHEPTHVSNEEPVWFFKALMKAHPATDLLEAVAAAAATQGLAVSHVLRWVDWQSTNDGGVDAEILSFSLNRPRQVPTRSEQDSQAKVTMLRPR